MEQKTREVMSAADEFMSRGEIVAAGANANMMPAVLPGAEGETSINIFGGVITAQRVALKRDMADVKARLMALAAFAGMDYVYSWEVNDRKNNRKVLVEGATIVLANDLAREWGNCQVDVRVKDEGRHWVFYGRFVDLQTGYSLVRAYQQRKAQDTGMKDDQRSLDLVFQIGQSKCIRNVIVNALRTMADFCVEEAKKGLLEKVKRNPDGARKSITKKLEELAIDVKRVNAIYTRTADNWTIYDMAKIWTEINSIADGMTTADDVYPTDEQRNASTGSAGAAAATNNQAKVDPLPPAGVAAPERKLVLEDGTDLNLGLTRLCAVGETIETGSGEKFEVVKFDTTIVVVKRPEAKPAANKRKKAAGNEQQQPPAGSTPPAGGEGTPPAGAAPATPATPPAARPNLFSAGDE